MKKNKIFLICSATVILLTAAVTVIISFGQKKPVSRTEFLLDTICKVTLYDWNGDENKIMDEAFNLCSNYEQLFSTTISTSDIYRINNSNGKPTEVAPSTTKLISDALEYCRLSNGVFDITILPVKKLWDFSGDTQNIPGENDLSEAVNLVDYTKVKVDGRLITLPKGMGIDLGAIAKGFVADEMADYLRSMNVKSAVIDLGGNIYTVGSKPDGSDWRIGIQEPFGEGQADIIEISNASAVTSGIYQRYFTVEDEIYHHILDARTGKPCDTGLYSVTVISENSERCDALSTVCMLIGYEKSLELLSQFPDTKAVFITSNYQILYAN